MFSPASDTTLILNEEQGNFVNSRYTSGAYKRKRNKEPKIKKIRRSNTVCGFSLLIPV